MLISDCLEFGASKQPDLAALIYDEQRISYSELAARTRRLANAMASVGDPGDRVAILSANRPEYVEAIYGVPRAGMSQCLLNYRLSPRELVRIVNDAEPSVVITEPEYLATVEQIRAEIPSVRKVILAGDTPTPGTLSYESMLSAASADEPQVDVDENDVAWLIYTSGTTGMPKGAMITHRNVVSAAANITPAWDKSGASVVLAPWPICHVAAINFPLAHVVSYTVVLMRNFTPTSYLSNIERHRCTTAMGAPTLINSLLQHPQFGKFDLSSLRVVSYGSAPMPAEILRLAMKSLPEVSWETNYGATELVGSVFFLGADEHRRAIDAEPEVLRSVGRQLPFTVVRIVDPAMNDVAPGDVGEIVVRGPQVMSGYWRRPEATRDAFVGGWFHTGDLGRFDASGRMYVVDRIKDMIITGGENVYSREVEEVLYTHPAVADAAVVGMPDSHWGERVVAVIQVRKDMTVDAEDLIALCRANLAGYKKPKEIIFVSELPRNVTGKILKRQLREVALAASPADPGAD